MLNETFSVIFKQCELSTFLTRHWQRISKESHLLMFWFLVYLPLIINLDGQSVHDYPWQSLGAKNAPSQHLLLSVKKSEKSCTDWVLLQKIHVSFNVKWIEFRFSLWFFRWLNWGKFSSLHNNNIAWHFSHDKCRKAWKMSHLISYVTTKYLKKSNEMRGMKQNKKCSTGCPNSFGIC